jgi:hypothetical protein
MAGVACVKFIPGKKPPAASPARCPVHPLVEGELKEGKERMDTMCRDIAVVKNVVVAIAAYMKVPIAEIQEDLKEMLR